MSPLAEKTKQRKKFETLHKKWKDCKRCKLCEVRTNVVVGHGNIMSRFLIVGQNPGADEDEQGKPFIGKCGKLLEKMIVHGSREIFHREDFYITNAVACLSPGNREPTDSEMGACSKRLDKIIKIIDPLVIICLGKIAIKALFPEFKDEYSMQSCRGFYRRDKLSKVESRRWIYCSYHPSYILRNPNDKKLKRIWMNDWRKITEIMLEAEER